MQAVEFQASIEDGMIKVPPQYRNIGKNTHVKLIMMYDDADDLEFKKNIATIEQQVTRYYDGCANILSENEYDTKMTTFMEDLKAKSST